jgi:hypothetical protein
VTERRLGKDGSGGCIGAASEISLELAGVIPERNDGGLTGALVTEMGRSSLGVRLFQRKNRHNGLGMLSGSSRVPNFDVGMKEEIEGLRPRECMCLVGFGDRGLPSSPYTQTLHNILPYSKGLS